jgi:hypothetical protein
VLGFAFVAAVESAAASEPGHGPFNGPAVSTESLRAIDALAGNTVLDASL